MRVCTVCYHRMLPPTQNKKQQKTTKISLSADGYELTYAVNVLAPFALTARLLPLRAVRRRVVVTASISAASSIDVSELEQQQQERGGSYSAHSAYSLSKACNIAHALHLAALLRGAGSTVTCNTLDPGTVDTKMLRAGW